MTTSAAPAITEPALPERKLDPADLSYEDKKVLGWCTRECCRRKALPNGQLCRPCRNRKRRIDLKSYNKRRASRMAAKLCVACPPPRPAKAAKDSTLCLACQVKRKRLRRPNRGRLGLALGQNAEQERLARIKAATVVDYSNRTRYLGQMKRGQQPKDQLNQQDLRHIRDDFEGGAAGIDLLASDEGKELHRGDKTRVEVATASLWRKAIGRMEDVADRLDGGKVVRRGKLEDESGDLVEQKPHVEQRHGPRGEK